MTTYIEFPCGDGVILHDGAVTEVIEEHDARCRDCSTIIPRLTARLYAHRANEERDASYARVCNALDANTAVAEGRMVDLPFSGDAYARRFPLRGAA